MKWKSLLLIPAIGIILACGGSGSDSNKATTVIVQGGPTIEQTLDVWAIPNGTTNFTEGIRLHKSVSPNQVKPEIQMPYQEGQVTFVVTEIDKRTVLASATVNVIKGFRLTVTANQNRTTAGALRTTVDIVGVQR